MITLGIDLSAQPKNTAACVIECRKGGAAAREPRTGCTDEDLDALIANADAAGSDAPFGWPSDFAKAVAEWGHTKWNNALRDRMRFRGTDRSVHERLGKWPLSVSTDRVALPAMRAMAWLRRHGVTDLSGSDGRFFEGYPAGGLLAWNLDAAG